ncbi:MAG TPA: hypothetical protein VK203_12190 [Nostocaceae cyanobacterium]|nr:hypothetical protein [Nostocaceae cyanobacterium]
MHSVFAFAGFVPLVQEMSFKHFPENSILHYTLLAIAKLLVH